MSRHAITLTDEQKIAIQAYAQGRGWDGKINPTIQAIVDEALAAYLPVQEPVPAPKPKAKREPKPKSPKAPVQATLFPEFSGASAPNRPQWATKHFPDIKVACFGHCNRPGHSLKSKGFSGELAHCHGNEPVICFNTTRYPESFNPDYPSWTWLHEVAHARTPGHGHDKVWAKTFAKLLKQWGYEIKQGGQWLCPMEFIKGKRGASGLRCHIEETWGQRVNPERRKRV